MDEAIESLLIESIGNNETPRLSKGLLDFVGEVPLEERAVEFIADTIAQKAAFRLDSRSEVLIAGTYVVTKWAILEAAQNLLSIGNLKQE